MALQDKTTNFFSFTCLAQCRYIYPGTLTVIKLTNQPTLWSRVLLGKLIVTQLVKKFLTFYGTQWVIIMFTRAYLRTCVTFCNSFFFFAVWSCWSLSQPPGWRTTPCQLSTTTTFPDNIHTPTVTHCYSCDHVILGGSPLICL
jgi:hypothetical protein